jgi:hypothetical protein
MRCQGQKRLDNMGNALQQHAMGRSNFLGLTATQERIKKENRE